MYWNFEFNFMNIIVVYTSSFATAFLLNGKVQISHHFLNPCNYNIHRPEHKNFQLNLKQLTELTHLKLLYLMNYVLYLEFCHSINNKVHRVLIRRSHATSCTIFYTSQSCTFNLKQLIKLTHKKNHQINI